MGQIEWVQSQLYSTKKAIGALKFTSRQNAKILICSHLEAKLISFAKELSENGFEVHLVSNLPSSIKTNLLSDIKNLNLHFYNTTDFSFEQSEQLIESIITDTSFDYVFDDGAHTYSKLGNKLTKTIFTEFTQSGVSLASKLNLQTLVINLNSSYTKKVIGNIYGTGISTLAAIQTVTNINFNNINVGIFGLGPIGLSCGIAFKGAGSRVSVYDKNISLSERASKNGLYFGSRENVLKNSDLIITCTGQSNVIKPEDFETLKDNSILANVGHFNTEISLPELEATTLTSSIKRFRKDNKNVFLLSDGNLVNLASGMGYPIQIIDKSFAAAVYAWAHFTDTDKKGFIDFPEEIDLKYFSREMEEYKNIL